MATNASWVSGNNTLNLQTVTPTEGIITSHILDDDMPDIRISDFPLARQDGQKFVSAYFGQKTVKLDGVIKSTTASGLDGQVDNFKLKLYPKAVGQLTVGRLTGDRLYNVVVKSLTITRDSADTTRAPYSAEFSVESGFGVEPTYWAMTTFSGVTVSPFQFDVLTSGTAPFQPEIRIKAQAASQWGLLTIKNLATGDIINFSKVWAVSDNMSIQTNHASVLVNGSGITYSGVMPRFLATSGVNTLVITALSGTQTFDIAVLYQPVYL